MNRRTPNAGGFTLLEVLLTLALTVLVLGLLGMAVDVHLRVTDASRDEVEQSQTAQRILRQMADDLRNAVPVTRASPPLGRFQGNREELQIDISRVPLLDQIKVETAGRSPSAGLPSDVRTVTYCLAKPGAPQSPAIGTAGEQKSGLMRSEWERATFDWTVQQGRAEELTRAMKLFAPEVEAIQFTYIDQNTVYEEWDWRERGKLPAAVKIAIALRPTRRKHGQPAEAVVVATEEGPAMTHEMLVDLPNARARPEQGDAASGAGSSSGSTSGGSTSPGTGNSGTNPPSSSGGPGP